MYLQGLYQQNLKSLWHKKERITMIVVKKDGSSMDYDSNRILRAVTMAIKRTGDSADLNGLAEQVLQSFESFITKEDGSLPVEIDSDKIRNIVESTLMGLNPPVATSYIEYRHSQDIQRKGLTDVVRSVSRVKDKDASVVNENANKDSERFNVERDLTAGSVAKTFGLKILPKKVANAHIKGDIHFHDLDYMPYAPMTNCFSRETRFITDKGIKSFYDFDQNDKVTVLTPSGVWKSATVKKYGKQYLNKVTLRKGSSKAVQINVTKNHRWILENSQVTTDLKIHDKLTSVKMPTLYTISDLIELTNHERLWWVKGFIYGDGSSYAKDGSRIRLCGNKNIYKDIFLSVGFHIASQNEYLNGDVLLAHPNISKSELSETNSIREIEMFISGLLEADGSYRNNCRTHKTIITLGKQSSIDMFRKFSSVAKYYVIGEDDLSGQVTNYAKRNETVTFRLAQSNHFKWKVIDIQETNEIRDVWCLEVEDEHAFILEHGIPTGNCCLIDFEGMLKNGFEIGNAEVESPKSIQTAVAQVAQIIANVSSSQYGGCSFDRADEVLAPYAEKNYKKYLQEATDYNIPDHETYAEEKTMKDIYDSMQSLEYEINTLYNANGRVAVL